MVEKDMNKIKNISWVHRDRGCEMVGTQGNGQIRLKEESDFWVETQKMSRSTTNQRDY